MSSLETKSIKQMKIGEVTQPLYIGGVQIDNSDADIYIDTNGEIHIPGANISSIELGYLDGVTSPIQTQINAKTSTGKAIAMSIVFG